MEYDSYIMHENVPLVAVISNTPPEFSFSLIFLHETHVEFFRTRLVVIVYYSISIISLSQINSEYDCTDGQAQQWA